MDRYLLWGFVGAIVVHTGALAAGTHLHAIGGGSDPLEQIQVFDSRAPIVVSPVTMVEWAGEEAPAATLVSPKPPPEEAARPSPQPTSPTPRPRPRPPTPKQVTRPIPSPPSSRTSPCG